MVFPECLLQGTRKKLPENRISNINLMYARHKPGSEWKDGDEYPDFSKIKSDQSFNWSAYSIPFWVKFNPKREYLSDYGIIGYSVRIIRLCHQLAEGMENLEGIYGLRHAPDLENYSHCELYQKKGCSFQKREEGFPFCYQAWLHH
jgi:hypothetical protein